VRDDGARERLQRDRVNLDYLRRALDYFKAIGKPFHGVARSDKVAWERAKAEAAKIGETKLSDTRRYLEAHRRRLPQPLVVHDRPDRIYGVGKPPQRPAE
jgi:ActR/RegA family two-component response regulator